MSRSLNLDRQHLEQDHNTNVAQITSTVKLWIEAERSIQAGGSDSLVLIEAGPGLGYKPCPAYKPMSYGVAYW